MWGKIILVFLIIAAVAGGGYYYLSTQMGPTDGTTAETDTTLTPEPTNTPTPEEVNREEYTIEVLNGGGVAGAAGEAQTLLEGEDFVVISTGNAAEFDYTETVVQAGEDVSEAWIDELQDTLREEYDVQSRVEEIDGATDADVVVIVGSPDAGQETMEEETADEEEPETETPTPTEEAEEEPTPTESAE